MKKRVHVVAIWMAFCFASLGSYAQVNQIYAISTTGVICMVDPGNASLKAISKTPPGNGSPNAMGYKPLTNTFYFFATNLGSDKNIFESFVPGAVAPQGTFTKLSIKNGPTGKTNAGCVSFDGSGYYCIDGNGYLYYYKISTDTWQRIATTIIDDKGKDITALFHSYNSGDIAFDGRGNLWFVAGNGSASSYCLYKLAGPVPTTNVDTVTFTEIVPPGATLPDGDFPVGISFNNNGQMFISTFNSDLYLWTSVHSSPIFYGQMDQIVSDMTSGYFPFNVLPVNFEWFKAIATDKGSVNIAWRVQQNDIKSFTVQRSSDGTNWSNLGNLSGTTAAVDNYSFTDWLPLKVVNYYRIKETDNNGIVSYSDVRQISIEPRTSIMLWPNPFHDRVFIRDNDQENLLVKIVDAFGRPVMEKKLMNGEEQINLAHLPPGTYYVVVFKGENKIAQQPMVKN